MQQNRPQLICTLHRDEPLVLVSTDEVHEAIECKEMLRVQRLHLCHTVAALLEM